MTAAHIASPLLVLRIWNCLSELRRLQIVSLLALMLCSAFAEVCSLSAVLPFLTVLGNPDEVWKLSFVRKIAITLGISQPGELLFPITIVFGSAVLFAATIRLVTIWLNGRVASVIGTDLSCEAYRRTLLQPYIVHVRRNSGDIISTTTSQIANTVTSLNLVLQLLTSAFVALGLLSTLFVIDSNIAFLAISLFGSSYALLMFLSHQRLRRIGLVMSLSNQQQIRALQEGLGAIRDVIMSSSQSSYLEIYRKADTRLRSKQAESVYLGSFPRYALEAIGLLMVAGLGLRLSLQQGNNSVVIPTLGAFALGAQRLLPALQQIYGSWSLFRAYSPSIEAVLDLLDQPIPPVIEADSCDRFRFKSVIALRDVYFNYDSAPPFVLSGIDVEINKGERVGIVGSTGSGKSTLVDLIMGLLPPTSGSLFVDGLDLHDASNSKALYSWRSAVAHVPQSIYLSDGSIAENIAFGVPREKIDMTRVVAAASQARLSAFIDSNQDGYNALVGERGIRLSGGQRQRIGIARALYRQAQILVLDEATSALDSETEAAVMAAIESLSKDLTVIIIAHRLSTVQFCDRIINLRHGTIACEGPPSSVFGSQ